MSYYMAYLGPREAFSINSRAMPGFKYRVNQYVPFNVADGDEWVASLHGMTVLSALSMMHVNQKPEPWEELVRRIAVDIGLLLPEEEAEGGERSVEKVAAQISPQDIEIKLEPKTYQEPQIESGKAMQRLYCEYGYLPRYCGAWLEGLATTLPDPARTLEIGTGSGCSLIATVMGLHLHGDAKSWTVDIEPRPHLEAEMEERGIDRTRWEQIHAPSLEVAKTWKQPLDMIYIDGDHSYDGAYADICAWEPHLSFGGLMIFDDYEQPMWACTKAIDDVMFSQNSTWRFVGQVGRLIAFEKGTLLKRAPWLTDYMVKYDSYATSRLTGRRDPWLWFGWGFPGSAPGDSALPRSFGESPKPHFEDKLP